MAVLPLNVEKIAIDGTEVITSGRVLQNIASASIEGALTVGGLAEVSTMRAYASVSPAIQLQNAVTGKGSSRGFRAGLSSNGTDVAFWNYENGFFRFGNNNSEVFRITDRMLVGTTVAGNSGTNGLRVAGRSEFLQAVSFGPQTTAAPSAGDHHDVDPGTGNAYSVTPSGAATITGLSGGVPGRPLFLRNGSTAHALTLAHNNSGSLADNRFICAGGNDFVIPPTGAILLFYFFNRWYPMLPITP